MGVRIEIRVPQKYPPYCIALLEQSFAGYAVASVTKHFIEGQSGTYVFLVEPTRQAGEKELPVVVKIGPSHLLDQEWRAAQDIASRLPDFVPISGQLASVAVSVADGSTAGYSAARYQLAGNGIFAIETLRSYVHSASADALWTVLEKRLFPQLDRIWKTTDAPVQRRLNATYDRVLPVNLLLEFADATETPALQLDATQEPASYPQLQCDDWVQLHNFVITEIDAAGRTLTLDLPQPEGLRAYAYRLRIGNIANLNQYHLHERVGSLTGRVMKTRQLLLQEALRNVLPPTMDLTQPLIHLAGTNERLPNPLLHWSALLQEQTAMRIGTVHGDLNMGNVLVDVDAKTTFLIDCAHAHRDHVLVDLARLESELLLYVVTAHFFDRQLPPTTIHVMYNWLDYVTQRAPNATGYFSIPQPLLQNMPQLQSAFIALTTIRNHARQYLAVREQWREYYVALTLTLLGSLKFASLDRATAGMNPKAVAFWGAATLLARLEQPAQLMHINWQQIAVDEVADAQQSVPGRAQPNVTIDYGDAVNTTNFHGPVTGPIHTGSGHIYVSGTTSREEKIANDDVTTTSRTASPTLAQRRIKILFLTANPFDTVRARTDEEARAIDQALRQAEYRIFDIAVHQAVRIDDLQDLLLRHRPDIVHFSGHGSATNEIILQDANGNATPVSGKALRALFAVLKDQIRCVVLNACYTDEQAKGLVEVIDCVVGISHELPDAASIQFATAFYRALGYGRSVQEAFNLGQSQIALAGLGEGMALQLYGAAQTHFGEPPTAIHPQTFIAGMPKSVTPSQVPDEPKRTNVREQRRIWSFVLLPIAAIVGITFVVWNFIIANPLWPTLAGTATDAPTEAVIGNLTRSTTSAAITSTATSVAQRSTVARPAPGANRYFIEGPDLVKYDLGQFLAIYGQDAAGLEFDVAVAFVVDKNVGNLIVQVLFQNENYPLDSLAALQLDDQLDTVDLASITPVDSNFVGFMLTDGTVRLAPHVPVKVGDQLEAVQLTPGGDTLPFADEPHILQITSVSSNGSIARVSSAAGLPPLGTLLVLTAESPTSTPSPPPLPTLVVTPTTTATPTPEPQPDLPLYESFDGTVKLTWENAQGEWGVNNQHLQVRRFEDGLASIFIANPDWPRYVVQLDFGTIKHLDDSGNVNVPFSNFHVLIHFQGNTDGYWFTVANGGVACTIYQNKIGTRLTPSTNQWGEMFDLLARRYTGDHDLKITVHDNRYTFILDDEEICSFQDDTYPEGSLGVVVSEGASGRMWIDNVRISPLE